MSPVNHNYDVLIIGGGLAGLCSAIHLSKSNLKVLLVEKNTYPRHKVCGEYISNEVLPYFKYLGLDVFQLGAKKISKFILSTTKGNLITSKLPLGGFGMSRYCLDHELFKIAENEGCDIVFDTVAHVRFNDDEFTINTKSEKTYNAKFVIGAYGKRSALDKHLNRDFIKNKSPYLAVKTHVKGNFPEDTVALHNFKGGYCGVSMVEKNSINLCYITNYESFQKFNNIAAFQEQVLFQNPYLKSIFENSTPIFDKPLSISQISFESKSPVDQHILMCGDTATLIHPLSGNGMSMAIRSAHLASNLILKYFNNKISSREALEKQYLREWNSAFKSRLRTGKIVSKLFHQQQLFEYAMNILKKIPELLPKLIKRTHGKPIIMQ